MSMLSDLLEGLIKVFTHGVAYSVYGAIIWHMGYSHYKKRKFQKKIQLFKNVFPVKDNDLNMDVFCSIEERVGGSKPPQTKRKYVHSAEALALKLISSKLKDSPLTINTENFYSIRNTNTNLLLLGGGAYNDKSGELMQVIGYHLAFRTSHNRHNFFEDLNTGKTYKCGCPHNQESINKEGLNVTSDYGIILRRRLPSGKIALVLAGIHMHGTLAAVYTLFNEGFLRLVAEKKSEFFVQLVHTQVDKDGFRIDPRYIEWRDLPFYELEC